MNRRRPVRARALLLASTAVVAGTVAIGAAPALAQQGAPSPPPAVEPSRDVIVVVGSQIVGARSTDTLAVNVVRREEIDAIAAPSGDELFRSIPQMGDVGFNSASLASTVGGVNAARGDVASINLRALGTGNTLMLLNGRRMVNHPGVQVENSVPVVTVNANTIPVSGVDRVEVLLDGASAIYGSDAVAGVVNTVLKSDFSGLAVELQGGKEQGVDAAEFSGSLEWGSTSDDGRTNVSLFGSFFSRDPVYASERSFSASSDLRSRLPADWASDPSAQAAFNGTSLTSAWGVFDRFTPGTITINGAAITNAAGQFHLQPASLAGCSVTYINGTCFSQTSTRPQALRYDINRDATVQNGVDRENLYLTFRHRFDDSIEMFGEAGVYLADSLGYREEAPMLGAVPIVIPASNYWNPFGPVTFANGQPNPNRLPGTNAPVQGLDLVLGSLTGTSAYRPIDAGPRKTEVENLSTRVVFGLRGEVAKWNWESALLYSQADTEDKENRISNTLFQQQLALSTPDAYNPFNGGCLADLAAGDCTPSSQAAIDAITVPVMRRSKTALASWDFKVSRPDALRIWSGDVGLAAGVEWRREDYRDDRDPRQDGSVNFVDAINPAIHTIDLMGQSASPDTSGKREVASAWAELRAPLVSPEMHIPFVQNVDLQLAGRYEDFDTFGDVTKPKVALSWRPFDFLMFRSAWSEGFRAPNLQQEFESGLTRNNNRVDFIFCQAAKQLDPSIIITPTSCSRPASAPAASAQVASLLALGASRPVTSNRQGSTALLPENSKNLTYGAVFEPDFLPPDFGKLTLTADWWRIEQTGVVGIFGDNNHILLDYALRAQGLGSDPAVVRTTPDAAREMLFSGTGIAAVGDITVVNDNYLNLDRRTVQGWDFGLYYSLRDTTVGSFDFRANAAFLDKFYQGVSPDGATINAAAAAGKIAPISVAGQGNQVKNFGRPEWRWTASLTWSFAAWQAGWFTSYVGDVNDDFTVRASDGAIWNIDSMQTHNLYIQYTLGRDHTGTRLRLGARNIFNEQPPLAATTFGYLGDIDNPAGRFLYGSIRKTF